MNYLYVEGGEDNSVSKVTILEGKGCFFRLELDRDTARLDRRFQSYIITAHSDLLNAQNNENGSPQLNNVPKGSKRLLRKGEPGYDQGDLGIIGWAKVELPGRKIFLIIGNKRYSITVTGDGDETMEMYRDKVVVAEESEGENTMYFDIGQQISFGREEGNAVNVNDIGISPQHANVVVGKVPDAKDRGYNYILIAQDLVSTGGTMVDAANSL